MPVAEVDGSTSARLASLLGRSLRDAPRRSLRDAPLGRSLRDAPLGRSLRAAAGECITTTGSVCAAPIMLSLRSSPLRCSLRAAAAGRGLLRVAGADGRTTGFNPHLRLHSTAAPRGLKIFQLKQVHSSVNSEEPEPKGSKHWLLKVMLLMRSHVAKLLLLCLCIWIGVMAAKGNERALEIADVCDKTHKIYNVASKAFLIILDIFERKD